MKLRLCACFCAWLLAAGSASAQQAPPSTVLSLEAAIAEGLQRSPALEPARDSVALSEIARGRARSEFGLKLTPQWSTKADALGAATQLGLAAERRLSSGTGVKLSGDFLRHDQSASGEWSGGYSFSVAQPLLAPFGPRTTAHLRDADRGVLSSQRALQESRRELVVRIAQAYFAVVRQQRLADAARRALDRAGQLRAASEARTQVGLATRLDVLRADLLASQASAQLEAQLESLEEQLDQLKVLLDRPLDAPLSIDASAPAIAARGSMPVDVDALVATAIGARLDLIEMRDRVADARRAGAVAKWNLVPDVIVEAVYTGRAVAAVPGAIDLRRPGWHVQVGAAYAFDRAGARASLASAEMATRAAERRLDEHTKAVEADVRRAARAAERSAATIAIQEKAVALAQQQLALAEMRYERGLAGNFDVIDAESNLFQAETALITAQVERALSSLLLDKAAGTLDPERYLR